MSQPCKTFLDLPENIRERILLYAGINTGSVLYLLPIPGMESLMWPWGRTYSLRRTSKAIKDQVKSILLKRNVIFVSEIYVDTGLEILQNLSPKHCRSLRHLFVHLRVEANPNEILLFKENAGGLSPDKVAAWQNTVRHVLSHVEPKMLTIHLVCDTGDSQTTNEVCEPLLEFPGKLKDCRLRLSLEPARHLSTLAAQTVRRIMGLDGTDPRDKPFRFMHLPYEVRHKILQYTDLVTPENQVLWSSIGGFDVANNPTRCRTELCGFGKFGYPHKCQSIYCAPRAFEAFCRSRHSAYSSSCHCWSPPKALMTVSWRVYHEAIEVLYTYNRIIVMPSGGARSFYSFLNGSPSFLDAAWFIKRHRQPQVLRYLRHLELVFPIVDPGFCSDPLSKRYLDLVSAMDCLRTYANLPILTMSVYSSTGTVRQFPLDESLLVWIGSVLNRSGKCLLSPLKSLGRMNRFFVHLDWQWHWTREYLHPSGNTADYIANHTYKLHQDLIVKTEDLLEQVVMGTNYNGRAMGKLDQRDPSTWVDIEIEKHRYR